MLALAKGEIHLIFGSNVFLIRLVFGAALVGGSIWLIWSASQSQNTVDSTCGTWHRNGFFPHFFGANQAAAVCQVGEMWNIATGIYCL